jgi:hypothetical protein
MCFFCKFYVAYIFVISGNQVTTKPFKFHSLEIISAINFNFSYLLKHLLNPFGKIH